MLGRWQAVAQTAAIADPRPNKGKDGSRRVILPGTAATRRTSDNSPRYVTVGEAQRRVDALGAATLHNVYCRMGGGNGQKPFVRRVSPGSGRNRAAVRRWLLLMAVTGER